MIIPSQPKGHPEPAEGWFDRLTMIIPSQPKGHPEQVR